MMGKDGKCALCGRVYTKRGMSRHLKSCLKKNIIPGKGDPAKGGQAGESLILSVEGYHDPQYWLYLEMPFETELFDLDQCLRQIWLECCGHMSAFKIRGSYYNTAPSSEWDEKDMEICIHSILSPGEQFIHIYDFGSSTVLALKVIDLAPARAFPGEEIAILARNTVPRYRCDYCNSIAVKICPECSYDGKGWLCEKCAEKHPCGEEMLLPVTNSPRVGVCGYSG